MTAEGRSSRMSLPSRRPLFPSTRTFETPHKRARDRGQSYTKDEELGPGGPKYFPRNTDSTLNVGPAGSFTLHAKRRQETRGPCPPSQTVSPQTLQAESPFTLCAYTQVTHTTYRGAPVGRTPTVVPEIERQNNTKHPCRFGPQRCHGLC